MRSDSYWKLFTMSGDPEAYLQYKRCKRLEERAKATYEFGEFEDFEDADNNCWNSDKRAPDR